MIKFTLVEFDIFKGLPTSKSKVKRKSLVCLSALKLSQNFLDIWLVQQQNGN